MLVATHDLPFAARTCERAVVLRAGALVDDVDLDGLERGAAEERLLGAMYPDGL